MGPAAVLLVSDEPSLQDDTSSRATAAMVVFTAISSFSKVATSRQPPAHV
jgi:hypothetical protein